MAKFSNGILGPFSGRVGTVVGYTWNGKCCMRAYNPAMRNPRTAAQTAHRTLFKQEVQLAAQMHWVLDITMREQARAEGMTNRNLFVRANQHAFSLEDGQLKVDYSQLVLSMGDVPGVTVEETSWTSDNVLTVRFERGMGNGFHRVYLYVYVPDLATEDNYPKGFLAAPVYRRDKRVTVALPDAYAGHTAQLFLMVQDDDGRWSETVYAGSLPLTEVEEEVSGIIGNQNDTLSASNAITDATAALLEEEKRELAPTADADRPRKGDKG